MTLNLYSLRPLRPIWKPARFAKSGSCSSCLSQTYSWYSDTDGKEDFIKSQSLPFRRCPTTKNTAAKKAVGLDLLCLLLYIKHDKTIIKIHKHKF